MRPLPSEETTPPVMKMNRAMGESRLASCWGRTASAARITQARRLSANASVLAGERDRAVVGRRGRCRLDRRRSRRRRRTAAASTLGLRGRHGRCRRRRCAASDVSIVVVPVIRREDREHDARTATNTVARIAGRAGQEIGRAARRHQARRAAAHAQPAAFRALHQDDGDERGGDDRLDDEQEGEHCAEEPRNLCEGGHIGERRGCDQPRRPRRAAYRKTFRTTHGNHAAFARRCDAVMTLMTGYRARESDGGSTLWPSIAANTLIDLDDTRWSIMSARANPI